MSLEAAYRATLFRVRDGRHDFVLRVGERSPQLLALYALHRVESAAYLTAYNPRSEPLSADANERAQYNLAKELDLMSVTVFRGEGEGTIGDWPSEPSFLALGLSKSETEELGRKYDQNAVVWAGSKGVPELIMITYPSRPDLGCKMNGKI